MKKTHYVYRLSDPVTNQYYIGSRTCDGNPKLDSYMGSYYTWNPENKNRLIKEIIKDDFHSREEAITYEGNIIGEYINDELNENYYIPHKGFHTQGKVGHWAGKKRPDHSKKMLGKTFTKEHKNKLKNFREGKTWEDIFGIEHATKLRKSRSKKYSNDGNPMYGVIPPKDRKDRQRNSLKEYYKNNKSAMLGKKLSVDAKTKISKSNSKKVIHIETGKIFNSQLEAANYFSIDNSTISYHCSGKSKINKFKFIT